jgi:hypothetical protein
MKERGRLEELGIEWKIILKWIKKKKKWEEVDCIHLTEGRHKWQASMNMVMRFQLP